MRRWWQAAWGTGVVWVLAACGPVGTPVAARSAEPSASASAVASASCTPYLRADKPLRARSSFVPDGGLDTLVIAAGEPICAYRDSRRGVPLSMAYVTFPAAGMQATPTGQHQSVGRYDGSETVRVHIPVLGSPCLAAAIYVGDDDIPTADLPWSSFTGVDGGPSVYDPGGLGTKARLADRMSGLIALDTVSGKNCGSVLRPAK